uniref:Serpentine receptor class gamma n=1 Tax=Meloidogyne floridensis TaxID=298350 RepID=A0A915NTI7_9BILA
MLRISFFLTYSTVLADFLATSLILVNRWTAIIMPVTYKRVWNKLILLSALVVFGIPSLLYIPILTVNCYLQNDTSSGVVCILLNIATLISYRKHCKKDKRNKSNQQIQHEKTEYKLMVYAIATFVGHLIILSTTIFKQPEYAAAVITQYPWTMDFGSVVLPSCITIKFNAVHQATMVKPVNTVQNTKT